MWCQLVVNVTGHTELQLYECKSDAMNHTSLDTVEKKTRFNWAESWRLNSEFSESSRCFKTVEIKCATNSPTSFPNYISNSFKAEFKKCFYHYIMLYVACTKCYTASSVKTVSLFTFPWFFPHTFLYASFLCTALKCIMRCQRAVRLQDNSFNFPNFSLLNFRMYIFCCLVTNEIQQNYFKKMEKSIKCSVLF